MINIISIKLDSASFGKNDLNVVDKKLNLNSVLGSTQLWRIYMNFSKNLFAKFDLEWISEFFTRSIMTTKTWNEEKELIDSFRWIIDNILKNLINWYNWLIKSHSVSCECFLIAFHYIKFYELRLYVIRSQV